MLLFKSLVCEFFYDDVEVSLRFRIVRMRQHHLQKLNFNRRAEVG
jgi:hypothetical protein